MTTITLQNYIDKLGQNYDYMDEKVLEKEINKSFENKYDLNKLLNLTEKNCFRRVIKIDSNRIEAKFQRRNTKLTSTIRRILDRNTTEPYKLIITENELKINNRTLKLTRFLSKLLKVDSDSMYIINRTMPRSRLNELLAFEDGKCILTTQLINFAMSRFVEKFIVNNDLLYVISTNPLDILTASENCSYTSCYDVEGSYHGGVYTALKSSITVIGYLIKTSDRLELRRMDESPKKMARQWIHIDTEDKKVIFMRTYNTISDEFHRLVKNHIFNRFVKKHYISNEFTEYNEHIYFNGYSGYRDETTHQYKHRETKNETSLMFNEYFTCLHCGRDTDSECCCEYDCRGTNYEYDEYDDYDDDDLW